MEYWFICLYATTQNEDTNFIIKIYVATYKINKKLAKKDKKMPQIVASSILLANIVLKFDFRKKKMLCIEKIAASMNIK